MCVAAILVALQKMFPRSFSALPVASLPVQDIYQVE